MITSLHHEKAVYSTSAYLRRSRCSSTKVERAAALKRSPPYYTTTKSRRQLHWEWHTNIEPAIALWQRETARDPRMQTFLVLHGSMQGRISRRRFHCRTKHSTDYWEVWLLDTGQCLSNTQHSMKILSDYCKNMLHGNGAMHRNTCWAQYKKAIEPKHAHNTPNLDTAIPRHLCPAEERPTNNCNHAHSGKTKHRLIANWTWSDHNLHENWSQTRMKWSHTGYELTTD